MIINLEDISDIMETIKNINSTPLNQLTILKNGVEIELDKEFLDDWKFMGLSNFTLLQDLGDSHTPKIYK